MRESDTHGLIQAALGGDGDARGALLERLRPRLVLWCASRMSSALRSRMDAEDMAQEVLLALHAGMDGFEGDAPGAFLAWTFTVAENRIRDAARGIARQKRREEPLRAGSATSPSEAAVRSESLARLREALESLPEDHRTVVRLRRLEERPTAEVAVLMERSENAVRVLYFRALRSLRERFLESGEMAATR